MTGDGRDSTPPSRPLWRDLTTLVSMTWSIDRRRLILQLVLLAATGLLGGVGLVLLVPVINSIAGPSEAIPVPLIDGSWISGLPLGALLAGFVLAIAAQAVIGYAQTLNAQRLRFQVIDRLRAAAFEAILAARWDHVLTLRRSDIIQVVTAGATRSGLALDQLLRGAVAAVLAVVTAIIAVAVAPLVGAVAVVTVVVVAVVRSTGIRPAYRLGSEFSERNRELQAVVTDSLDSLRLVRAHDAAGVWSDRLAEAFAGTRDVQMANTRRVGATSVVTSIGLAVGLAMLVLISVGAGVEPPALVMIVVVIARLNGQVGVVVGAILQLANSLPAVGDIGTLTDSARAAVESAGAVDVPTRSRSVDSGPMVEFRSVTFRYGPDGGGVTDLDLVVPTGRITALTGRSGAGKSTTADLALGLLQPQSGEVRVAGEVLTSDTIGWWRSQVAYVPQETLLLPGTLRDNLAWSIRGAVSDEACWAVLRRARATFVEAFPEGLDTVLGERGVRLSGGERQRIAIARALLRDPRLIVLDEATSALDDETEAAVLEAISGLTPEVTVLLIAHRESSLRIADSVIRL